jgi:hypothetical protein
MLLALVAAYFAVAALAIRRSGPLDADSRILLK